MREINKEEIISQINKAFNGYDFTKEKDGVEFREDVLQIVDRIYDDFKLRTCNNCKHYERFGKCGVVSYFVNAEDRPQVSDDFCCNQWKAKKDEKEVQNGN